MTVQRMLPLYEAKMIHHYDHRWATYGEDGDARDFTQEEKVNASGLPQPRYWVREELVADRLKGRTDRSWLMGWRNIARATDERTTIASVFPAVGVGHSMPLTMPGHVVMLAALSSFVSDYVARQKVAGTNFTFNYFQQMPAINPKYLDASCPWAGSTLRAWVSARVIELAYTANDMAPFAEDLGDDGEPFVWNPERRFWLRAELDAAFFHLYGVEREDVEYIMDTFPIVKRKDIAAHGSFRTKEAILSIYDAMARAIETSTEYETVLSPPPGEGPRHEAREQAS